MEGHEVKICTNPVSYLLLLVVDWIYLFLSRITHQRLAQVERICQSLSLQKDSDDMVLNLQEKSEKQPEDFAQQGEQRNALVVLLTLFFSSCSMVPFL